MLASAVPEADDAKPLTPDDAAVALDIKVDAFTPPLLITAVSCGTPTRLR